VSTDNKNQGPRGLLSIGAVARRLGWNESTIRRHTVPYAQWGEREKREGKIPVISLGAREYVPAWWVDSLITSLGGDASADSRAKKTGSDQT